VFSIQDEFDFSILEPFEAVCDYFLLILRGITQETEQLSIESIRKLSFYKTIFLSGGIGPEELDAVEQIIKTNLPFMLSDVNSKFETAPGLKKIKLVRELQQNLKLLINIKTMS
jgi:phosphoribosylanthranilate isomerase